MSPQREALFESKLRQAVQEARSLGYHPAYFLSSLGEKGAYRAVLDLIQPSRPPSQGFVKLFEKGRLDLSVEAIVLEGGWSEFFPEDHLRQARQRLLESGYVLAVKELDATSVVAPDIGSNSELPDTANPTKENVSANVWKITGPPENFLVAIERGCWALNEGNESAWKKISAGDLVVFHSTRDSGYFNRPKSSILGFARVGIEKFLKTDFWWPTEVSGEKVQWPNVFDLDRVYLATPMAAGIDRSKNFEDKSEQQRVHEVELLLRNGISIASLETEAKKLKEDASRFPVNGSIARLSDIYRKVILEGRDWYPLASEGRPEDIEQELLPEAERSRIATMAQDSLLEEAASFVDPSGPSHKSRVTRVRIECARQKHRVAALESFTCQVCDYRQSYLNKKGEELWIIHVDHIVEKSKGGGEQLENLWVLCPKCHAEKTAGVLTICPSTFVVERLGVKIGIRDSHLSSKLKSVPS